MADLKIGSTVGGSTIWHQGIFPLTPSGNSLTYRSYKVYTEYDKPQASNNDFVSKAEGGTYTGKIRINQSGSGVSALELGGNATVIRIRSGGTDDNTLVIGGSSGGIQIRPAGSETSSGSPTILLLANGNSEFPGRVTGTVFTSTNASPSAASDLTRKDYVDTNISNVTTNANSRVLRAGDTMTGLLTAPQLSSVNNATNPEHVPRLSQVITKGTIIDFGTF